MTQRRTIAAYMVTDLTTLAPDLGIGAAASLLLSRGLSGAPVVDRTGDLVGMLTKKDCFKAALNAAYYNEWTGSVARYMTPDPQTMDADLGIVAAAEVFLATPYRRFPVLRDGRLAGLLSRSDLLRAFAEETGLPHRA